MTKTPKPTMAQQIAALTAKVSTLETDNRKLERDRDSHKAMSEKRQGWITEFKQEVTELAGANAELRGYIQRVLEDDAVREIAPGDGKEPPAAPTFQQRENAHRAIDKDFDNLRRKPQPKRAGPSSMMPRLIVSGEMIGDHDAAFRNISRPMAMTNAPPTPIEWQDRY